MSHEFTVYSSSSRNPWAALLPFVVGCAGAVGEGLETVNWTHEYVLEKI